jgi:hypothetical protein
VRVFSVYYNFETVFCSTIEHICSRRLFSINSRWVERGEGDAHCDILDTLGLDKSIECREDVHLRMRHREDR